MEKRFFVGSLNAEGEMLNEVELRDFADLNKVISRVGITQDEIVTTECLDEVVYKVIGRGFYFRAQW